MALIACPECSKDVSTAAASCPNCGHPILASSAPVAAPVAPAVPQPKWNKGIAAVLSLVIPGAGQMYKGQVANGLVWLVFVVVGYLMYIVPGLVFHMFCIIGAASGDPYK